MMNDSLNDSQEEREEEINNELDNQEDEEVGDIEYPDWNVLNGKEIYEHLCKFNLDGVGENIAVWRKKWDPTGNFGSTINQLFKKCKEKRFLFEHSSNTEKLAQQKKEAKRQRDLFANIGEQGLSYVRAFLTQACLDQATKQKSKSAVEVTVNANAIARVASLNCDPACIGILSKIFGGSTHEEKRSAIDNPQQRTKALWGQLASDFFNNAEWKPSNDFTDDDRIADIDPSELPQPKWTAEKLRLEFSKLRTVMTTKTDAFKRSGQIQEGEDHGDGDDEFHENAMAGEHPAKLNRNWNWGRNVFLFIYLLYDRSVPSWGMRDLAKKNRVDLGFKSPGQGSITSTSDISSSGSKGRNVALSKEDLIEINKTPMEIKASAEETAFFKKQSELLELQLERARTQVREAPRLEKLKEMKRKRDDAMQQYKDLEAIHVSAVSRHATQSEIDKLNERKQGYWNKYTKLSDIIDKEENEELFGEE